MDCRLQHAQDDRCEVSTPGVRHAHILCLAHYTSYEDAAAGWLPLLSYALCSHSHALLNRLLSLLSPPIPQHNR